MKDFIKYFYSALFLVFLFVVFVFNLVKLFYIGGFITYEWLLMIFTVSSFFLCLSNYLKMSVVLNNLILFCKYISYLGFFILADLVTSIQYNFLDPVYHTVLNQLFGSFFWLTLCVLISRTVDKVILPFMPVSFTRRSSAIVLGMFHIVLYIFTVMLIVNVEFGINIITILLASGIITTAASLILAFSAKSLLTDIISGVTLSLSPPFLIGDFITITGPLSENGRVADITWLTTRLIDPADKAVIIPNSKLIISKIVNHSVFHRDKKQVSVVTDVSISLPHSHKMAIEIIKKVVSSYNKDLNQEPSVYISKIDSSRANYVISFETEDDQQTNALSYILATISEDLDSAGFKL